MFKRLGAAGGSQGHALGGHGFVHDTQESVETRR